MSHGIGETSRLTGLSPDTLRYYERIGLLPPVPRDAGGRRRYRRSDLERLGFIQRGQRMGFSLEEIKQLLELRHDPRHARPAVRRLTEAKLSEIERRLQDLTTLRNELTLLLELCRSEGGCGCPIIERFNHRIDD